MEDAIIYRKTKDLDWKTNLTVTTFNIGYAGLDKSRQKTSNEIKLSKHFK